MIVLPDGACWMTTEFYVYKRIVDSTCGNPTAYIVMESYKSRADLINSVMDNKFHIDVSRACDFSLNSMSFSEIEQWAVKHVDRFIGANHEPT